MQDAGDGKEGSPLEFGGRCVIGFDLIYACILLLLSASCCLLPACILLLPPAS